MSDRYSGGELWKKLSHVKLTLPETAINKIHTSSPFELR